MIIVKDVNYKKNNNHILQNINLNIDEGDNWIFMGPSGSGKSTFLKSLCNLKKIESGSIQIEGKNLSEYKQVDLAKTIGIVLQEPGLFENFTILKNLTYPQVNVLNISEEQAKKYAEDILKEYGIEHLKDKMPNEISKGLAKKISILRVFLMHPKYLILDDPSNDLDPEMFSLVSDAIKKLQDNKITTIISTNNQNIAKKLGKKLVFFNEGKIEEVSDVHKFFEYQKSERAKNFVEKIVKI